MNLALREKAEWQRKHDEQQLKARQLLDKLHRSSTAAAFHGPDHRVVEDAGRAAGHSEHQGGVQGAFQPAPHKVAFEMRERRPTATPTHAHINTLRQDLLDNPGNDDAWSWGTWLLLLLGGLAAYMAATHRRRIQVCLAPMIPCIRPAKTYRRTWKS